jgi:hypothetical protein
MNVEEEKGRPRMEPCGILTFRGWGDEDESAAQE